MGRAFDGNRRARPRRQVVHAAIDAVEMPAAGGLFRIIVIDRVVVGTQRHQVGHIRRPAILEAGEVMNLRVLSRCVASRPRARRVLRRQREALLGVGETARHVQVHRAVVGMDEGDEADVGKLFAHEFRTGHRRPIRQLQFDLLAITVDDAVELI